jgi:predicted kinase
VSTPPGPRSVKIDKDERGGWSSDRPRREGGPSRLADLSVRSRVLRPSDRMRYSPGSLVVVVSGSAVERDRFAERVFEDRSAVLSLDKVRTLLAGKVPEPELEARAGQLLDAAVRKRLEAGQSVVLAADGVDADERERFVRLAAGAGRPRHLILLEAGRDQVPEEYRAPLNDLRRRLDAGELGAEGFQTVIRLGGAAVAEVKRILFRPPPSDD